MGNLYGHKNIKEKFYGRNLRAANGRRTLFQDFTTGLHEPFPTLGGKKGSRVRVAASCVVEEMMHLHCYSGASLKTLTSDRFIDEI